MGRRSVRHSILRRNTQRGHVGCKALVADQDCERLARDVFERDTPHVVIIDGDYDVLSRARSEHRRVVRLSRYGVENYLAEHAVIDRVIARYTRVQHQTGPVPEFGKLMATSEVLLPHVAFDIAAREYGLVQRWLAA